MSPEMKGWWEVNSYLNKENKGFLHKVVEAMQRAFW